MASEIKVDTIVNAGGDNDTGIDLATNDQILLKVANATKLTMNSTGQTTIVGEGGTTTTNLQQGLIKVWISQDGTASNAAAYDSFNVSGTTDNGTGDYTVTISNDMSSLNYSVTSGGGQQTGSIANNDIVIFHKSLATGQYGVQGVRLGNLGVLGENTLFNSMVSGDLA